MHPCLSRKGLLRVYPADRDGMRSLPRFTRRQFLGTAIGGALSLSLLESCAAANARLSGPTPTNSLPPPSQAPFDHVIVVMMENRSFDHLLGWLPGANGRQAGLTFTDIKGVAHQTYDLAPLYQSCGHQAPNHTWEGGLQQLAGGRLDGFLLTAQPGDTLPIGYYSLDSVPVLGGLALHYTTFDNYFSSILAETYPNRLYQHAAQTDRDHNTDRGLSDISLTIWDRLADAHLKGIYYHSDESFLALFGDRYTSITRPFQQFLTDCTAGTLPDVAFVDPVFGLSHHPPGDGLVPIDGASGTSGDDHPPADIRVGEAFIAQVYHAVRQSPSWDRTVLIVNFDEWGGFFEHVPPPMVVDDHVNPAPGPHPDYRQLGFRVPCVVISPFSPQRIVSGGAPFEHTSVLRMIEWRWNLPPLTARDAHARNLAEVLDFSKRRTDSPPIPSPVPPHVGVCAPTAP